MKRILISLATIGLVVGVVVAVTGAWFSDEEVAEDNTFTAGTLDLEVGGGGASLPFEFENLAPSDTDTDSDSLVNSGTIAGTLSILLDDVVNETVTTEEPEDDQGTDTGGDLGANLLIALWLDLDEDGVAEDTDIGLASDGNTYDPSVGLDYDAVDNYDDVSWADVTTLDPDDDADTDIVIDWELPDATDNSVMSDSVSFDLTFNLDQVQP